jgi:inosine/xanthosine triphosphate pyrophosphatase family protein
MATQRVKEKMKITEHDAITNISIDREMTQAEIQEFEARQIKTAARQSEAEAKATQRQAIADRLGLTADELQVLLG